MDAFELKSNHDGAKIDVAAMSDSVPMLNDVTKIPTSRAVFTVESALNDKIDKKTSVRYWDAGTWLNGTPSMGDIVIFTDTTMTTSGDAVFYLTSNHLSTGTALCSSILTNSVNGTFIDSSGNFNKGATTVAGSLKSVTVASTKQASTGLSVLGLNVAGTITYPASPNGTTVNFFGIGVSI